MYNFVNLIKIFVVNISILRDNNLSLLIVSRVMTSQTSIDLKQSVTELAIVWLCPDEAHLDVFEVCLDVFEVLQPFGADLNE